MDTKTDLQQLVPEVNALGASDTVAKRTHWLGLAPPALYESTLLMAEQPKKFDYRMWCHLPTSVSLVTVYRHWKERGTVVVDVEFHGAK
jgi:hypothetical protein